LRNKNLSNSNHHIFIEIFRFDFDSTSYVYCPKIVSKVSTCQFFIKKSAWKKTTPSKLGKLAYPSRPAHKAAHRTLEPSRIVSREDISFIYRSTK
jgi:hypothetical protein